MTDTAFDPAAIAKDAVALAELDCGTGARHACRALAPEAVLALEGHGIDRVFTDAVGSLRAQLTVTGPGGHSWWDRGRPSAVHELVRLLHAIIASASAERADTIATGASQLRAVLQEVLELRRPEAEERDSAANR